MRSAAQLARQLAVAWHAVYVETPALQRLDGGQRERILQTVKLAQDLGASAAVLPAQAIAPALLEYARRHNLSKLVLGRGRLAPTLWAWWPHRRLGQALAMLAPDIDRMEVGASMRTRPVPAARATHERDESARGRYVKRYLLACTTCAAAALLSHWLMPFFDLANIVMVFLLAVVGVGVWFGRGPAVLAAVLNVAVFDFFFVAPRLSFAVADV